jgi:hypothetical protein
MLRQETMVLKSGEYPIKTLDAEGDEKTQSEYTDFGRDNGKIFRFTEMSAMKLEKGSIKIGSIAAKTADKHTSDDMKETERKHSAALAYLPFALSNEENFLEFLDYFNELIYNYEIYNKNKDCYVKITPDNEADYIEEVVTVGFLRNKAMELLNFFRTGGNANITKATQAQPPDSIR